MASVRSVDNVLGFGQTSEGITQVGTDATQIPVQGNLIRNIIEGADLVMSHITHFYHLTALDYIGTNYTGCPISGQAPWDPKDNTADMVTGSLATTLILNYVAALDIRREAHRLAAYVSGKQPCTPALIPGGVTKVISGSEQAAMTGVLATINNFIDNTYIPNVVTVATAFSGTLLAGTAAQGVGSGCKKYLAYGTFPDSSGSLYITGGFLDATDPDPGTWATAALDPSNIKEHIKYSYYDAGLIGNVYSQLHPSVGVTKPLYNKSGAYTWLKAPRYHVGATAHVAEVGPLARVLVNTCATGTNALKTATVAFAGAVFPTLPTTTVLSVMPSVLGRHAARAIECQVIAHAMTGWINSLSTTTATGQTYRHRNIPRGSATGYGLTEAPRGALGHWIRIDGGKISSYQAVVPTTWNCGPKDDNDVNGPIEQAISGTVLTDDATGRTKIGRIIRSFDPCIACSVHLVSPDKKTVSKFEIVPQGFNSCK